VAGIFFRRPPDPTEIVIVGARRTPFSDLYHDLLRAPWWIDLLCLSGLFLLLNLLFGLGFLMVGGVAGARPDSLADHFFFSVQTMGTIGYGVMHPLGAGAGALVTLEVIVSVSLVALASGLLFSKFSVPRARMQFAESATISPVDGVPTLMFRVGNERASQVIEAQVRVVLLHTERTAEGVVYCRMRDLRLERDRSPAIARSWTVMHGSTSRACSTARLPKRSSATRSSSGSPSSASTRSRRRASTRGTPTGTSRSAGGRAMPTCSRSATTAASSSTCASSTDWSPRSRRPRSRTRADAYFPAPSRSSANRPGSIGMRRAWTDLPGGTVPATVARSCFRFSARM
jgi:hypothetical protein